MPAKLKNLRITSTDLVDQGANQEAFIRLFKRRASAVLNGAFKKTQTIEKEAATFGDNMDKEAMRELTCEMFDYCCALEDSFASIICDAELDEDAKRELLFTSLDEFAEIIRSAAPQWASGKNNDADAVRKQRASQERQAMFESFYKKYAKDGKDGKKDESTEQPPKEPPKQSEQPGQSQSPEDPEEDKKLDIDKSKMTPEEQALLTDLEKRYGVEKQNPIGSAPAAQNPIGFAPAAPVAPVAPDPIGFASGELSPEMHSEVKKALADLEEVRKAQAAEIETLKKDIELERLTGIAKKYELIGKKAAELAPKLYSLKKAGGTAYDDYVALLDEHMNTVEKSGLFAEFGKNTSGNAGMSEQLGVKAAEVRKTNTNMSQPESVVKAFEENPELAAQYENEYRNPNGLGGI